MADQQNPFTMAGMMGMMMPNPYTQYKGALPMPGFQGTPTDAQGNPIQSYLDAQKQHDAWDAANPAPAQGTTLNSAPSPQGHYISTGTGGTVGSSFGSPGSNMGSPGPTAASMQEVWIPGAGAGGAQQPAAPARPQNPVDMRQAYLTALSNPGKVTTPGATVPESQPLGTPSVLNAFLAAHPGGGGAGAGNYNNTGFFNTLNKLRSA